MFGLTIKEPYRGYIGWRAILSRGYVDIVPNRGSSLGDKESQDRLIEWVNKPMILPPLPKRKRPRKITPWKQMQEAAKNMRGSDRENWEVSEGPFVLRCNPCASYGYLYIALFEKKFVTDPTEIDDTIDAWHEGELKFDQLHEALGWTREQYAHWVETQQIPNPPTENEHNLINQ